jgi:hypothetical protein
MKIFNMGIATVEAVRAAGVEVPVPPSGASVQMKDCVMYPVLPDPPQPPWKLR